MSEQPTDKRKSPRYAINEELAALGNDGQSYVSDLSAGGIYLHTSARVPLGQLVELRFTLVLDDPVVIEAHGRVVRYGDDGMGIAFEGLSPDMVLRLHDAVGRQRAAQQQRIEARALQASAAPDDDFDNARTGAWEVPEVPADDLQTLHSGVHPSVADEPEG